MVMLTELNTIEGALYFILILIDNNFEKPSLHNMHKVCIKVAGQHVNEFLKIVIIFITNSGEL